MSNSLHKLLFWHLRWLQLWPLLLACLPLTGLALAGAAKPPSYAGVSQPQSMRLPGTKQVLMWLGSGIVMHGGVQHYAVHFYGAARPQAPFHTALEACHVRLVWLDKPMSAKEVQAYFIAQFKAQVDAPSFARLQPRMQLLLQAMPETARGAQWSFEYSPDSGLHFSVDGLQLASVPGLEISRTVLSVWVAEKAPLRAALTKNVLLP
jgi:hypothetical protein